MKKAIIAVVILAIISGVLFWQFGYKLFRQEAPPENVQLKIWALWEDKNLIQPAIDAFEQQNPNIEIEYELQNIFNYRTRVQTQIDEPYGGENSPPDIFMIHNSWLPMFLGNAQLSAIPQDILSPSEFSSDFYDVVSESFSKNGLYYAIPLGIDGLSLFYNQDLLDEASVSVPKSWDEFRESAKKLTIKNSEGQIIQAGAAIGTTGNVDHWPDIIGLLFLQNPGADLEKPNSSRGAEVISFYTNFIKGEDSVWDASLESSTQAFYTGKLAFYFAPSWRVHDIRVANQNLNFKTAPVPQLPCAAGFECPKVGWATFWGFAVSASSPHQKEAWQFLKFLTSEETQILLYQQAAGIRLFGEPYSRVSLRESLLSDPIAGSFVEQAPYYKSWYLSSRTFDSGINDEMIKYFEDAINAVTLQGVSPQSALNTTALGVHQVLDKYNQAPAVSPR